MGYAARAARERAHDVQARKLFVGTPMYEGLCHGQFALASIELSRLCAKRGVEVNFCFSGGESLITRARNYLVDDFLASGATHLLFLDADLGFDPDDVLTLLTLDRPVIGAPCPKKTIAWDQVAAAARRGIAPSLLPLHAGDFALRGLSAGSVRSREPVEVEALGTGFMMIARPVFEQFRQAYPELAYVAYDRLANPLRTLHAYFDTAIDPASKEYLAEDWRFCQWCRRIGIPIYVCPWMNVEHIGQHRFVGSFAAGGAATASVDDAAKPPGCPRTDDRDPPRDSGSPGSAALTST
jgi:hypothetical protein